MTPALKEVCYRNIPKREFYGLLLDQQLLGLVFDPLVAAILAFHNRQPKKRNLRFQSIARSFIPSLKHQDDGLPGINAGHSTQARWGRESSDIYSKDTIYQIKQPDNTNMQDVLIMDGAAQTQETAEVYPAASYEYFPVDPKPPDINSKFTVWDFIRQDRNSTPETGRSGLENIGDLNFQPRTHSVSPSDTTRPPG